MGFDQSALHLYGAAIALGKPAQHSGVKSVFKDENPRGQTVGRIGCINRQRCLPQDRPVIKLGRDFMHRAAMQGITGLKRACMRVKPLVLWQQGGMDIDHAACPLVGKTARQFAHEARQTDDIGPVRRKGRADRGLKGGTVPGKGAVINHFRGDTARLGPGDPARIRLV